MLRQKLFGTIYPDEEEEFPGELFVELMRDAGFHSQLEEYFKSGDIQRDSSLHLVGRLGGGTCFLFQVIKEDCRVILKLLLSHYVPEVTSQKPWLRLAEPLLPFNQWQNTAFHTAVFYGRAECLQLLLDYASKYGHTDRILQMRNIEEKKKRTGHNLMEMANAQRNFKCFNILAPLYGEDPVAVNDAVDRTTRETLKRYSETPRLELVGSEDDYSPFSEGQGTRVFSQEIVLRNGICTQLSWSELAAALDTALSSLHGQKGIEQLLGTEASEIASIRKCKIRVHVRSVSLSEIQRYEDISAWLNGFVERHLRPFSVNVHGQEITFRICEVQFRKCSVTNMPLVHYWWLQALRDTLMPLVAEGALYRLPLFQVVFAKAAEDEPSTSVVDDWHAD